MERCTAKSSSTSPVTCFEEKLGLQNPPDNAELQMYVEYLRTDVTEAAGIADEANLKELQAFEPGFFPATSTPSDDPFPVYEEYKVVDGQALIP